MLDRLPGGFERVARATGWHMVGHVTRMCAGLLVGIYVARYLGPESYGILNYAISFAFLFSALAHLGLADIVVRDLVAHPERQGETLGSAFALRLASGTLALGLATAAAWATHADAMTRLMVALVAGSIFFEAISLPAEWFKAKVLARPLVVAGLIGLGIASALRVGLVMLGKPVVWFAWPTIIEAVVVGAFVLVFYCRYGGPSLAEWRPRVQRMRQLLAQSWPLTLTAGLVVIQQRIDQVMLGAMSGPTEVGWYAAATRLAQLWHFVPFAIATAVFPVIVRAKQVSEELYDKRMQAFFDLMLWIAVAISLPATLIAKPLVLFLYGDAFAPSADILQVYIWALVLTSVGIAVRRWIVVEGLTRIALAFSVISLVAKVGLNLLLIPRYGGLGAAWATLGAAGPVLMIRFFYGPTRPAARMMLRALVAPVRAAMRS